MRTSRHLYVDILPRMIHEGVSAYFQLDPLKAYRLSELNFLFVLIVANIRCFILIKCSEQKSRFKKSVIMA